MTTAAPESTRAQAAITAEVSPPKCRGPVPYSCLTRWTAFVCVIPGTPPVLVEVQDITSKPPDLERFVRRYLLDCATAKARAARSVKSPRNRRRK